MEINDQKLSAEDILRLALKGTPNEKRMAEWKVYDMNDGYCWIARSAGEAWDDYFKFTGTPVEDCIKPARRVPLKEMKRRGFVDEERLPNGKFVREIKRSFQEQFERIAPTLTAPDVFAYSEI